MVIAVRGGRSLRSVARDYGVSLDTVRRWVNRAGSCTLGSVDWSDRPRAPHQVPNRLDAEVESLILGLRTQLRKHSDLGEYGAAAIQRSMLDQAIVQVPCVRTINRVLSRCGAQDAKRRVRRPPPPPGWYVPEVAEGCQELDQWDVVAGLVIEGGIDVEVLNAVSVHGGLIGSWPAPTVTAEFVREALCQHWRLLGLPGVCPI